MARKIDASQLYLSYLPSLDTSTWALTLHKERQHYADLRQKYITSPASDSENDSTNDLAVNNPLSLDQANPWQEYFKDTELRKIIRQDVERTFPDKEYFRSYTCQTRLLDILFIYCKMNQDVSYRQGMHELLAPILWVVDYESLPSGRGYAMDSSEDTIIKQALNADFVEHDTFALFSLLMKSAKVYYEYNDEVFNRRPIKRPQSSDIENARIIATAQAEAAKLTPVVMKCNKIHEEYLRKADPELYNHLKGLEIEPQLYGIRWIRLLFGREFPLDQVLLLWDGMFSEDPTLRIVDFVCVAMMLLIRDELLESDYAGCLSMLMRYPPVSDVDFLVKQAIFLRDHMTTDGGAQIILQNAIRAGKSISAHITTTAGDRDSNRNSTSSGSLDVLVPDGFVHVTKNVLESRSAVALNKAILSAVGEVKVSKDKRKLNFKSNWLFIDLIDFTRSLNNLQKNVLRRPEHLSHESRKRASDFPSRFGNSIPNNHQQQQQQRESATVDTSSSAAELARLREQNRQMAGVVSKSIELLEQELFVRQKNREIQNLAEQEKIEKSSDRSRSSSFDDVISSNEENSALTANEISILHALTGLKHVRDVLDGTTRDFNPGVFYGSNHSAGSTGEEHDHWEVVDDEVSVVSVLSTTGEDDETSSTTAKDVIQSKHEKILSVTNSQRSTLSNNDVFSISKSVPRTPSPPVTSHTSSHNDTKHVSKKSSSDSIVNNSAFTTNTNVRTRVSANSTSSTTKGTRPQSIVSSKPKLNLDDVLKDVANSEPQGKLSLPKATISSNSKYSWMVEGSENDENSLFSPKRGNPTGSINRSSEDDIFSQPPSSPKQRRVSNVRSSMSTNTTSLATNRISLDLNDPVDPLSATIKNSATSRDRSGSVGSTSSFDSTRLKSGVTATSIVPTSKHTEDPLGVL
ncbi:12154_t:CDS:2 [Ambispora gerdemannii]|uniref:12154_t:CDS:1 n=1 Tax=Ambispora gerdemannii TaxID=144530 RepID=A0A9N8Z7J4_9GLOM|nr:12154_t:CDS:2 [Ambispora gerdemannii]